MWIVVGMLLVTLCCELLSNSKPIYMNVDGKSYFPIYQYVHPSELGLDKNQLQIDYRKFEKEYQGDQLTTIWPPNKWDYRESDLSFVDYPSPPDRTHILGTDDRGRDVLARIIYGLRNCLLFALANWVIAYMIGILAGALQGYYGGKVDFLFQRYIEVISAMPLLFLLIILNSFLSPNIYWLVVIISLISWFGISRFIRAEFLKLRRLEFVEAANALGVGKIRLFLQHLFPNSLTPVLSLSAFFISQGILTLSALDYLGFGLPPPAASWGELLNQAKKHVSHAWWLAVYPSAALVFTLVVFNFLGEGLRSAFDPKSNN